MTAEMQKAIEREGWRVLCDEESVGQHYVELEIYSPCGEDVIMSFDYDKNHPLSQSIIDYYENFDVDYEVYIWLGEDGHGRNGAPYHIKEILKDKEWQERKLEKLALKLAQINR